MKPLTKVALGAVIASTGLIVANTPVQAALLGDTVQLEIDITSNQANIFTDTAVVVDPGVEFNYAETDGIDRNFTVDVFSDSFTVVYDIRDSFTANSLTFILSDLDWVDTPGFVTGLTLTSGPGAEVVSTSFTPDSVTVSFAGLPNGPLDRTWSFDIQTEHESTPEPGTILGLLTLAGLGLGSRIKRNHG